MNPATKENKLVWEFSDTKEHIGALTPNSVPWNLHATCNLKDNDKQCYETLVQDRKVALCVQSTGPVRLSVEGERLLSTSVPREWAQPIDNVESRLTGMQQCHRQQMSQLTNTEVTSWVKNNDAETCDIVKERAYATTDMATRATIESIYNDKSLQPYDCIIDTAHVSRLNRTLHRDMQWKRDIEFPCLEEDGWTCPVELLDHFNGGKTCGTNDDCHSNIELGVCDDASNVCKTGYTRGSTCTTHEDCDTLGYVPGTCNYKHCQTGHTEVEAKYYKPKDCAEKTDTKTHFQYCGAVDVDGQQHFTGICDIPRDANEDDIGKTLTACRPFTTSAAVKEVREKEEDYQRGNNDTRHNNFHIDLPPWERLTLCNDVKRVDGDFVCLSTTEEVSVRLSGVVAMSVNEAHEKCSVQHPTLAMRAYPRF